MWLEKKRYKVKSHAIATSSATQTAVQQPETTFKASTSQSQQAYPESLQTQQDRQQTQHESQQTQHESHQLDHGRTSGRASPCLQKELLLALDLGDVLSGSDSDSDLEEIGSDD